jgi:hypothetical protein
VTKERLTEISHIRVNNFLDGSIGGPPSRDELEREYRTAVIELDAAIARAETAEHDAKLLAAELGAQAGRYADEVTALTVQRDLLFTNRDEAIDRCNRLEDRLAAVTAMRDALRVLNKNNADVHDRTVADFQYRNRTHAAHDVRETPLVTDAPAAEREAPADPTSGWPLCASCGKSAREGNHATDLGVGHDYVPAQHPVADQRGDSERELSPPAMAGDRVAPDAESNAGVAGGGYCAEGAPNCTGHAEAKE